MCLIAFSIGTSKHFPLVIASNRDEFLDRPTLPLGRWQTGCGQEIISGRDVRTGGTWLGINPTGRVAFLTNVREAEPKVAPLSRGELVTCWLESQTNTASLAKILEKNSHRYAGFNLVLGDMQCGEWAWMTNRPVVPSSGLYCETLVSGVYGLSNAALDTPWPKTLALKNAMKMSLNQAEKMEFPGNSWRDPLWTALSSRIRVPVKDFPAIGTNETMESALSSVFVEFSEHGYGTRTSTVLVVNRFLKPDSGKFLHVDITEKTYSHTFINEVPSTSLISFDF